MEQRLRHRNHWCAASWQPCRWCRWETFDESQFAKRNNTRDIKSWPTYSDGRLSDLTLFVFTLVVFVAHFWSLRQIKPLVLSSIDISHQNGFQLLTCTLVSLSCLRHHYFIDYSRGKTHVSWVKRPKNFCSGTMFRAWMAVDWTYVGEFTAPSTQDISTYMWHNLPIRGNEYWRWSNL